VKRRKEDIATDEELIRDAKSGDRGAFTLLVKRYEDTVFRFSLKLCRDREKAEETLQDTFINVYRKLGSFDGKSKFSTWLYTVVANNCLMKRRKRKLQGLEDSLELLDHPASSPDGRFAHQIDRWEESPADILLGKELRQLLDESILKLPEIYRAVFILRDVEGKSNEETAKVLSISQEAAKSRLRRARAFLREQLDPYMTSHRERRA
jgi:RNA polymerase sigma-70 factor (ECF subfamily)